MTYYLKISLWRIIKGLGFPIFMIIFFLIIHIVEYFEGNFSLIDIRISVVIIIITSLPCLILLVEHLTKDYNSELIIDLKNQKIFIKGKSGVKEYNHNQLKSAILVQTLDNKLTLLWNSFGYLRLEFKDDSAYYFSTLLFSSTKFWIWELKTMKTFFPLISRDMKNTFYIE